MLKEGVVSFILLFGECRKEVLYAALTKTMFHLQYDLFTVLLIVVIAYEIIRNIETTAGNDVAGTIGNAIVSSVSFLP